MACLNPWSVDISTPSCAGSKLSRGKPWRGSSFCSITPLTKRAIINSLANKTKC